MYNLVSRIQDGLGELKKLLETHIHNQGLAAIEKCGEAALNVSNTWLENQVDLTVFTHQLQASVVLLHV
jgi:cullin 1